MTTKPTRHLLGISGGKDNAALAVCMCDRVPEILFGSEQTAFQFYEQLAKRLKVG
jgi:hypothetical protein